MASQRNIGVDLGTSNTIVYVPGKGVVLREQSVVAVDASTGQIEAVGESAKKMIGRTPQNMIPIRPLQRGVVVDFTATSAMLSNFLRKVIRSKSPWTTKPHMTITIPTGATAVERQAVHDVAIESGAKSAETIEKTLAAAIGAGLPITEPTGSMVVDIGAGTTEVAIISLGGIVTSTSMRIGGDDMDSAIGQFISKNYSLLIGEGTAESVKLSMCSVGETKDNRAIEIRGRNIVDGLPKAISVPREELTMSMSKVVERIVACVRQTLEKAPPELAADVFDRGIVLVGGGSLLPQLDTAIAGATGLAAILAESPLDCIAIGTGNVLTKGLNARRRLVPSLKPGSARTS